MVGHRRPAAFGLLQRPHNQPSAVLVAAWCFPLQAAAHRKSAAVVLVGRKCPLLVALAVQRKPRQ
jgi:hypothetical protein